MKPTSFFDLPWALQDILLSEMDTLDYDSYEYSRAECIHDISNGDVSDKNKYIIDNFYKNVSVEHLQLRAKQCKESHLLAISALDKIIG
jgi:hypothetical protein